MTQDICPDRDTLAKLLLGKDPGSDRARLEEHFLHCEVCVSRVETITAADGLTDAIRRRSLIDEDDALDEVLTRARQIRPPLETVETSSPLGEIASPVSLTETVSFQELGFLAESAAAGEIGRLGGYRLLEVLGAGGMGIVFRAEDPALNRQVALKVMKPSAAADESARDRFTREARATAAIEHDHIVAIYQVGEDQGVPFIAMPLLQGESLKTRLDREQSLEPAEALRIAREVALGLAAAHASGLIHRDIKPDNIWLEADTGRVKIVDFGLVRNTMGDADGNPELTGSGVVLGTPQYMSPEQARGKPVDHRSDLFSLGVVMYQMLSGIKAFQRDSLLTTLVAIEREDPPGLVEVDKTIPAGVNELVMQLLQKDPELRLQTAVAIVDAQAKVQAGMAAAIGPATSAQWGRRKALIALGVGGVFALLLGLMIAFKTEGGTITIKASDEFDVTTENQVVTIRDTKTNREYSVQINKEETLPSGKYQILVEDNQGLKFSTREFQITRGKQELVVSLATTEPNTKPAAVSRDVPKQGTQQPATTPVSCIALTATPTRIPGLKSWTLETRYHRSSVYLLEASQDGKNLATVAYDGTIRIWNTDDFEPSRVLYVEAASRRVRALAWSPDGKYVAYVTDQDLAVLQCSNWQKIYSYKHHAPRGKNVSWSHNNLLLATFEYAQNALDLTVIDVDNKRLLRNRGALVPANWQEKQERIVLRSKNNEIVSWDILNNKEQRLFEHKGAVEYSPNFEIYAEWDEAKQVVFFKSTADDTTISSIPVEFKRGHHRMFWSPDSKSAAFATDESPLIRVHDVVTGKELPGSKILPSGNYVVWLSKRNELAVWRNASKLQVMNVETGKVRTDRITHTSVRTLGNTQFWEHGPAPQGQLVWSPKGTDLISMGHSIHQWNVREGTYVGQVPVRLQTYKAYPMKWNIPNQLMGVSLTSGEVFTGWTWNFSTGIVNECPISRTYGTTSDGRTAVSLNSTDGRSGTTLNLIDIATGDTRRTTELAEPVKYSGYCCTNGDLFVPLLNDSPLLEFWSTKDGKRLLTVDAESLLGKNSGFSSWFAAYCSPDSKRAVLGCISNKEQRCFVWDLERNRLIRALDADTTVLDRKGTENIWIDSQRFVAHADFQHRFCIYNANGELMQAWADGANIFGTFSLSPDKRRMAYTVPYSILYGNPVHRSWRLLEYVQVRNLQDGRVHSTHCILPTTYDYDLPLSFGPTGHWHCPREEEMRKGLVYVAVTDEGQRLLLSPDEFEQQFGWKNDPSKVVQ